MNGCAPGLALIERLKATRKWAIRYPVTDLGAQAPLILGKKIKNHRKKKS